MAGRQHAPRTTQASFPQVVPGPRHEPWAVVHAAWVSTWQPGTPEALAKQHAPVGPLQGLGSQLVFGPRQTPPVRAWQLASVLMTQGVMGEPAAVRQQAPLGAGVGQVVEVQAVPAPRYEPWLAAHALSVEITQVLAPLAAVQHAPVGVGLGQEVGVQVVPAPR